jgi:hypothetical protein
MTGAYLFNSLVWSAVGAFVGYHYCRMRLDITELKRRGNMEETPQTVTDAPPPRWWDLHRPAIQRVVGIVVVVMALISVSSAVAYSRRLNSVSSCLASYVKAYNNVLADRDNFAEQSRSSLRDFITSDSDLWKTFLANIPTTAGVQPTQAQRDTSIAALNNFFIKSDRSVQSLDAVSAARNRFPIPENLCPDPSARTR